ncbi:hypothetical protein [Baekduia sp. Peel2402]|uniref:hypothetical protein n=1 Tax=Baekduia sp. Peel2402 TaxID=3458296 RepID=UPI00403E87B5
MRTTNKAAMMAATAVLGVGAGVGLAIAGDDAPETWQPQRTEAAVPATAEQKAAFATLGAEPGAEDPDRGLVRQLAERSQIGLDADGARVVGETATGPVWLAPANGGVCIAIENTGDGSIGTACEGSDDVVARGTTVGDGTHIYGVAPDGVDAVTVTPGDGPPQSVTVSEQGLYVLPSQDATVALDGPSGTVSFTVAG